MTDKRPSDDHSKLLINSVDTIFSTMLDFIKALVMASVFFTDRAINAAFCTAIIVIINAFAGYYREKWKTMTIHNFRKSQRTHGILKSAQLKDAIEAAKLEGPYSAFSFTLTEDAGQKFGMKIFYLFGELLTKNDPKFNSCTMLDTESKTANVNGVMIGLFPTDVTFGLKNILSGFAAGQIFPLYVTKSSNYICITRNDSGCPVILYLDSSDRDEFFELVNQVDLPESWAKKKGNLVGASKNSSELSIITIGDDGKQTKRPYPRFPFEVWVAEPKDTIGEMIRSFDPELKVHKPGQRMNIFALVSGPPGTGKSSLARVLGTHFGRSIVVVRFNGDFEILKKTIEENQDKIVLVEEFGRFASHFGQESLDAAEIEKRNADKKAKVEKLIIERLECLKSLNAIQNKESPGIKHTEERIAQIDKEILKLQGTESQFGAFLNFIDTLMRCIVLFCSNNPPKIDTAMQRRFTINLTLNYFNNNLILEMIQLIYRDIATKEEIEEFARGNYPPDRYTGSNIETLANGQASGYNFAFSDYKGGKLKLSKLRAIMENKDFWPEQQDEDAKRFANKVNPTKPLTEKELKEIMKKFEIKTPDAAQEIKVEEKKVEETKGQETKGQETKIEEKKVEEPKGQELKVEKDTTMLEKFNVAVSDVTLAPVHTELSEDTDSENSNNDQTLRQRNNKPQLE